MNDAEAWALAESVLAPGETLAWAEAAPTNPTLATHLALMFGLFGLAAGAGWYGFKLWTTFLPGVRAFSKLGYKAIAFAVLGLVSVVLAGVIAIAGLAALLNGLKSLGDNEVAYAITDRQAMFVYAFGDAPYAEPLTLDVLRINRSGDDLRFAQPFSTELFGIGFEPVFYDLDDAAAVATRVRDLARVMARSSAQAPLPAQDAEALAAVTPELYAHERVLWAQRADGRPYVLGATARWLLFALVGVVLLFGAASPLRPEEGDNAGVRLIIAPIGLGLTLWAISSAGWSVGSGHVYYALTDQRVVVVRTKPWRDFRSFGPWYAENIRVDGDIIRFCNSSGRNRCSDRYLSGVRDAEATAQLIRETLAAAPSPRAE